MSDMLRSDSLVVHVGVKKTLRARSNEDENVPDCNRGRAHATPIVCMCGMQTGSEG